MEIKWNEVTWYSKLLAALVLLGAFPALTFYIGTKYQETVDIESVRVEVESMPISKPVASTKVAFFGDQGLNDNSKAVLNLVKSEGADLAVHLGDFDYANNPSAWESQINGVLGENFPYIAVIGNHDEPKWQEYQKKIVARLAKTPDVHCEGDIGFESSCIYRDITFALSSPGIHTIAGHDVFLADRLSKSKSLWNVCAWHEDQQIMQVGDKTDEVGWAVYETCKDAGAIIATGHEHSYERTYLLSKFETPTVVSTSTTLELAKGRTFAFVSGLGGESIRPQKRGGDWWASIYTTNQNASYGALFCTFDDTFTGHASCYFKSVRGDIPDRFEIRAVSK